jgi:hypothetical protein
MSSSIVQIDRLVGMAQKSSILKAAVLEAKSDNCGTATLDMSHIPKIAHSSPSALVHFSGSQHPK